MRISGKTMKAVILFAAVAFVTGGTWADEWTDPDTGYTWTYRIDADGAKIQKNSKSPAVSPTPTGDIIVPAVLGGKPVRRIGDGAFYWCNEITSIVLPDSVTSIGASSFFWCASLSNEAMAKPR